MEQQVVAEAVKVQQIEKLEQVKVQDAEIARREKELIATVLKTAEVERARIETLAAAGAPAPDDRGRRPRAVGARGR
jgi:flotillin